MRKVDVVKCKIITLSKSQVRERERERENGTQLLQPFLLTAVPGRLGRSKQDQVKYADAVKKSKQSREVHVRHKSLGS